MKDITHYFQSANPKADKLVTEKEENANSSKFSQKNTSSKTKDSKKGRKSADNTNTQDVPKRRGRPKKINCDSPKVTSSDVCEVEINSRDNQTIAAVEVGGEQTFHIESDVKEIKYDKVLIEKESKDNEFNCNNHTDVDITNVVCESNSSPKIIDVLPNPNTIVVSEKLSSLNKNSEFVSENADSGSVDLCQNREKIDTKCEPDADKQCETGCNNGTEELKVSEEHSTNEVPCSTFDVQSDDDAIIIRDTRSDQIKPDQVPKCKSLSLKKRKSTHEASNSVNEQVSASNLAVADKNEMENINGDDKNVEGENVEMNVSLVDETKLPSVKKTESSNAFKVLMSVRKEAKVEVEKASESSPQEPVKSKRRKQEAESEEVKVPSVSRGKRKRIIESDEDEELEEDPKQTTKQLKDSQKNIKSPGIFTYFSPVSKDEALKKSAEMNSQKVVCAEVHPTPKVENGSKHPLGPVRRDHRLSNGEGDTITVVACEESTAPDKSAKSSEKAKFKTPEKTKPKTHKQSKFKTPEKSRRTRPHWQLKIKLLSPFKPTEESTEDCDLSGTDSEDSDSISSISPDCKQHKNVPLAPIFLPRQRKQEVIPPAASAATSKKSRQIFPLVAMAPVRAAPTEHTIGFAEYDSSTPMAVLFPSISHITQLKQQTCQKEDCVEAVTDPIPNTEVASASFPPGEFVNITSPILASSAYRENLPSIDCQQNSETWCEQYRPMSSEEVAGNVESVMRLRDWLEGWKLRRRNSEEQVECDSDDESCDLSSSDDFICDSDDESDDGKAVKAKRKRKKHCNTALLVGPCGTGKTSAVYAAAEELGFKVLEMNASSRRSGKRILSELQEATQSHQVRNKTDQATMNSFFSDARKPKGSEEVKEIQPNSNNGNPGLSLILVEDVDVIFEEQDEGFLAALNVLAASSKRPLVLVSNDPQCALLLSRQHRLHLEFKKIPKATTGIVIEKMCGKVGDKQLATLTHECDGDLRCAVMLAQLWTGSGGFPQISANNLSFPLDLSQLWYNMSTISLPFILSQSEVSENNLIEADTTWNSGIAEEDESPVCNKKAIKRRRIDSDNSVDCEISQSSTWPADLPKTQRLTDILSILDVLRGSEWREMVSYERPGLSDQECHEQSTNQLGQEMQHWLASKALTLYGANLAYPDLEEIHRWEEAHKAVDREMMNQMPLTAQLDHHVAAQDLLPYVRDFGRTEQISARSSRRSKLNALTTLGFTFSPASMENLQFIFTPSLDSMEIEIV